jgi:hypothetical protein
MPERAGSNRITRAKGSRSFLVARGFAIRKKVLEDLWASVRL